MKRNAWAIISGLILLAVALLACSRSPASGTAGKLERITVGYIPILIDAPLYIGIERGYFKAEGLEVKLEPLAGGADMLLLTAAGQFDVGTGGVGAAFFNAVASGTNIRIVAPLHAESPPMTTPLMVGKKAFESGKVRTIQDLRGKPVSLNARGAATEYWLDAALRKGGLTMADINLQTVPFNNAAAALENGAVAAAMIGEPFATLAEQQGIALRLADDFLTNFQPTFVYLNPEFATKRKDAARRFVKAYIRASRDLRGDAFKRDEITQIMEKYTQVPAAVVKASAAPIFNPNGQVNLDNLAELQRFFMAQGLLKYQQPLDIAKMVDASLAQAAVKELGPVR